VRYAEVTGAELTLAVLTEKRPQVAAYSADASVVVEAEAERRPPAEELERISRVFRASELKPHILHMDYDPSSSAVYDAVSSGAYDLVVIGTENRAIQHRLFFGYDNERLIRDSPVPVVIIVPNLSAAAATAPAPALSGTRLPTAR
jgi:hypothetical protein